MVGGGGAHGVLREAARVFPRQPPLCVRLVRRTRRVGLLGVAPDVSARGRGCERGLAATAVEEGPATYICPLLYQIRASHFRPFWFQHTPENWLDMACLSVRCVCASPSGSASPGLPASTSRPASSPHRALAPPSKDGPPRSGARAGSAVRALSSRPSLWTTGQVGGSEGAAAGGKKEKSARRGAAADRGGSELTFGRRRVRRGVRRRTRTRLPGRRRRSGVPCPRDE